MKHFVFMLSAAIVILSAGCRCTAADKPLKAEKELKAVLYVDAGASGNGVHHWAELLKYSPGIKLYMMTAKDIQDGKLSGMDLILLPGGYAPAQYKALTEKGAKEIRKFVENGGAYVGTCAGLASVLNDPNRLKLLPFHRLKGTGGKYGTLAVEINEKGAKLLNVKPGKVLVRYAGGPIPTPGAKANKVSTGEVLAVYKNTVSYVDKPHGNFFNEAAAIYGIFGKGKVIATGFHPEYWDATYPIAMGCIYAVTGLKTYPVMPVKAIHPQRVGYYTGGRNSIDHIEAMFRLNSHPQIDIKLIAGQEIREGDLRHLDMLVLPAASAEAYKKLKKDDFIRQEFLNFMVRGGKLFVVGNASNALPAQAAGIPVESNQKLTPELLLKH